MFDSLIQAVAKFFIAPTLFLLTLAGYNTQVLSPEMAQQQQTYLQNSQAFGGTQPFAGNTYNLAGSGISSSATTINLTGLTIKQTGQPILTADLVGSGGTYYVTIEPGSNTKQEIIGCTGVTQLTTYAALTGCSRGLSPIYPYGASTTLAFTHSGGSQVIFSNPPQLFAQYANRGNTEYISGIWGFGALPIASTTCTGNTQLCNKAYIDAGFNAGAATSTFANIGISWLATQAQIAAGTASSTSGAPLVIPALFATSTPGTNATTQVPVTILGKLSQSFLDLTASFTPSGTWNFTNNVGIGTSTPYAPLSVAGFGGVVANMFTATSTTATSTLTNLVSTNNASSTYLFVSNKCVGCTIPTTVTNTGAGPTASGSSVTVTATCTGTKLVSGGGGFSDSVNGNGPAMTASRPSGTNAWQVQYTVISSGGSAGANTITAYAICVNP